MSIRHVDKDHLKVLAPKLEAVHRIPPREDLDDPLVFWTQHPKSPFLIDLHFLAAGQTLPANDSPNWNGGFSGRPLLTAQLAPAIKDKLLYAPRATCVTYLTHLRAWWRSFDELESAHLDKGGEVVKLESVAGLSAFHAHKAIDSGFGPNQFSSFRSVAEATRQALGLRPLHWLGPDTPSRRRHLPPPEQIALLWRELKHRWFSVLDRWSHAQDLLLGKVDPREDEEQLVLNYSTFVRASKSVQLAKGHSHPSHEDLRRAWPSKKRPQGISTLAMYRGFYPDPQDIRAAFHLCLAGTGWNAQTLLDLEIDISDAAETRTPFLVPHPSDPTRFILIGRKNRGESEHIVYGDWKTDRSPGAVISALVKATWPMRLQIIRDLRDAETAFATALQNGGVETREVQKLRSRMAQLKRATTSVWLYYATQGNMFLTESGYASRTKGDDRFLPRLVDDINGRRPADQHIPYVVAGDFRDAFAHYVWRSSGGSILHVMKALGHRSPRTTGTYLDNTAVNADSAGIFRCFSNALWEQLRNSKRLDPTLLAKVTRDGRTTPIELSRLEDYRALKRSRIGVLCRDPHHPPVNVDPNFVADGISLCTQQRCTLCLEHAVITHDSFPGLTMRLAELNWLQARMPVDAFLESDFRQELENTVAALSVFDGSEVAQSLSVWTARIERGEHRVVEFQGVSAAARANEYYL